MSQNILINKTFADATYGASNVSAFNVPFNLDTDTFIAINNYYSLQWIASTQWIAIVPSQNIGGFNLSWTFTLERNNRVKHQGGIIGIIENDLYYIDNDPTNPPNERQRFLDGIENTLCGNIRLYAETGTVDSQYYTISTNPSSGGNCVWLQINNTANLEGVQS